MTLDLWRWVSKERQVTLVSVTTKLDTRRTTRTLGALKNPRGPVLSALNDAAGMYKQDMLVRFDRFSRGGGDWRKLRPATVRRKRSSAILVDTRAMRLGLAADIARTGLSGITMTMSIRSRTRHPRAKMPVARLATIHHLGLGRVPARRILIRPSATALGRIRRRIIAGVAESMKG